MLLTTHITVRWNGANIKYYKSLGHIFTKRGDELIIPIEHLQKGSEEYVEVQCDYCGDKIEKPYKKYNKQRKITNKDCCNKIECKNEKLKDSNISIYGVEHYSQTDEYKKKFKETSMNNWGTEHPMNSEAVKNILKASVQEKYGVDHTSKVPEIKQKIQTVFDEKYNGSPMRDDRVKEKTKQTNMERYGVEWNLQSKELRQKGIDRLKKEYGVESTNQLQEVKDKKRKTCIEKWGVEYITQNNEVKEKIKKTNIEKYGVEVSLLNDEVSAKREATWNERYGGHPLKNPAIINKILNTLSKNGNAPLSAQQQYLYNILGGELNYVVSNCMLDIAFPNENIYIEYDGGGHDLQVKCGSLSEKEFLEKERRRELFLKDRGWKIIRIISSEDILPTENAIIKIIKLIKKYLKTGHTWFHIDINNKILKCSEYERKYHFKKLKHIKWSDIDS